MYHSSSVQAVNPKHYISTRCKVQRFIFHGAPVLPALSSSREASHPFFVYSYHVPYVWGLRRPYYGRSMHRLIPLTVSLCGYEGVD
jgi:hypothetical protein